MFEVEALVGHREVSCRGRRKTADGLKAGKKSLKLEYLVRWKGYTERHDTYEPREALTGCGALLRQYKQKGGLTVGPEDYNPGSDKE